MKTILANTSNWKFIVPTLIAFVGCIYLFYNAQESLNALAGEEATIIDMRRDYTADEITSFFTKIKAEGRQIHQHITGVVDMIFPLAYGLLYILISAFFLKHIAGPKSNWLYISLFPILLIIVDYKENFNTLQLLSEYPNLTTEMVSSAAKVTGVKSILTDISTGFPAVLGLIWLGKKLIKR